MLSRASKYAILSVLYLAIESSETKKINVKEIAEELDVPSPFLAKLFQQLVREKVISSTKGPRGGFYLSKRNSKKRIIDVIAAIDGVEKLEECFLGLHQCDSSHPCPVHFIVKPFKDQILSKFRDKTIIEFAQEIKDQGRVLTLKDLEVSKELS